MLVKRDKLDFEHMRQLLAFSLSPDACCIDVGAHRGALLRQMVRVAPNGRHWAFEPLPHLAAHLRASYPGVEVRQAALSNHVGESTFTHVRGTAEGCSGLLLVTAPPGYATDVEEIRVRLEVLDDLLPSDYDLALIKIDVEGAEQQVLEGALGTLRRCRPIIIFEHAHAAANAYGTEPGDIFRLLCTEAQLRVFDLDGRGPYSLREFRESSFAAERVNYVARP